MAQCYESKSQKQKKNYYYFGRATGVCKRDIMVSILTMFLNPYREKKKKT